MKIERIKSEYKRYLDTNGVTTCQKSFIAGAVYERNNAIDDVIKFINKNTTHNNINLFSDVLIKKIESLKITISPTGK